VCKKKHFNRYINSENLENVVFNIACISELADLQNCRGGCSIMLEEVSSTVRFCARAHRTRLLSFFREWSRQLRVSGCLDGGSFHVFCSNRNHINL